MGGVKRVSAEAQTYECCRQRWKAADFHPSLRDVRARRLPLDQEATLPMRSQ